MKKYPSIKWARAFVLVLLVVCGTGGCLNFDFVRHITDFPNALVEASTTYRETTGHWPASLDDLRSFDGKAPDEELRKDYAEALRKFPWDQLAGKTFFKTLPDGSLSISIPPLHQTWSGQGNSITWDTGAETGTITWEPGATTATFSLPGAAKSGSSN